MFTDVQRQMVDLIADKLRNGIVHPGDASRDVAPTPIALPFGRVAGRPKEMDDLLDKTATLLAEAVVHTVVTEGDVELVARAEAATMRINAGEAGSGLRVVPIHCRCDTGYRDPLAILTVADPDRIVIDGPIVLGGLAKRSPECPHELIDP